MPPKPTLLIDTIPPFLLKTQRKFFMPGKKKTTPRPNKDQYFLNLADVVATRGTCPRLKVGTVLVKDNMVISTGYNGAPRGLEHCDEVGCKIVNNHCVRAVHSEINSILQAAYHGTSTNGAILYTKYFPCENCTKAIINSGIEKVVFREFYKNTDQPFSKELFRKARVKFVKSKT